MRAIKWIGLQLLFVYTGLCLVAPVALVVALIMDHYAPGVQPWWPSSLAGGILANTAGLFSDYWIGRTAWRWLKPEWFA